MASSYQESGLMQTEHESEAAVDISRDIDIASEDFPEVKIADTEFFIILFCQLSCRCSFYSPATWFM